MTCRCIWLVDSRGAHGGLGDASAATVAGEAGSNARPRQQARSVPSVPMSTWSGGNSAFANLLLSGIGSGGGRETVAPADKATAKSKLHTAQSRPSLSGTRGGGAASASAPTAPAGWDARFSSKRQVTQPLPPLIK